MVKNKKSKIVLLSIVICFILIASIIIPIVCINHNKKTDTSPQTTLYLDTFAKFNLVCNENDYVIDTIAMDEKADSVLKNLSLKQNNILKALDKIFNEAKEQNLFEEDTQIIINTTSKNIDDIVTINNKIKKEIENILKNLDIKITVTVNTLSSNEIILKIIELKPYLTYNELENLKQETQENLFKFYTSTLLEYKEKFSEFSLYNLFYNQYKEIINEFKTSNAELITQILNTKDKIENFKTNWDNEINKLKQEFETIDNQSKQYNYINEIILPELNKNLKEVESKITSILEELQNPELSNEEKESLNTQLEIENEKKLNIETEIKSYPTPEELSAIASELTLKLIELDKKINKMENDAEYYKEKLNEEIINLENAIKNQADLCKTFKNNFINLINDFINNIKDIVKNI